jgi:membrane associated rhomboid family serine protease
MFPLGDNIASTRFAAAVWGLIAVNVAIFLYQLGLSAPGQEAFLIKYALIPRRYFSPSWASEVGLSPLDVKPFLTNTFLHGGFLHIIINMWTLYIFGPALEERLGSARFLALYLGAGVIASLAHALFNPSSALPALGASGANAGVIAAYALSFPHAWIRVLVLIVIIPIFFWVPALLFAGLWFLMQVLQGTSSLFLPAQGGGIAWWAHIGGFLAGWFLLRRLDTGRFIASRVPTGFANPWFPFRWFR